MKILISNKFGADYIATDERLGFDFPQYCAQAGRPLNRIHWLRNATYFQALDVLTLGEGRELVEGYHRRAEIRTTEPVEAVDFDEHQTRGRAK